MRRTCTAIFGILLLTASCTDSHATGFHPSFASTTCPADVASVVLTPVRCGYLTVPEDRAEPDGRTIRLFVAIVGPSSGRPANHDPVYSPGGDLGDAVGFAGMSLVGQRVGREAILMDQRGTGHSEPQLDCPEVAQINSEVLGARSSDPTMRADLSSAVAACRDRLTRQGIDVAAYDVEAMARDAIDLRQALGIDSWNLQSYGTYSRVLLATARLDPTHVRSLSLDSPQFPQTDDLTQAVTGVPSTFSALAGTCAAQPACAIAYPHLSATILTAERRLDARPVTVTVRAAGRRIRVMVDAGGFVRAIRSMLTDGDSSLAPLVPRAATRAARGDVGEIASVLADAGQPGACVGFQPKCEPGLSLGVYLSAMCRDEVPFVDPSQLAASVAGHPGLVEAYGNPPILDDCRAWNVPPAPAWMHEAVTSPVPTLVFSGGYDSYSDPGIDRRAVEDLSNASVVVIPYFGHNVLGTSQAISIRNAWLDQPTARPDTSSLGAIRPPSFEIR